MPQLFVVSGVSRVCGGKDGKDEVMTGRCNGMRI